MRYNDLIQLLQTYTNEEITMYKMATILNTHSSKIKYRKDNNSKFTNEEVQILCNYFKNGTNLVQETSTTITNNIQRYEIPYWEGLNDDLKLTDLLTSKWEDVETIVNLWGRKPENLRVIAMYGNAMEGYWYRLNNRDLLLMDISSTDLTKSGVYLFTTDNGKNIFIRELFKIYDGSVIAKRYEPNSQVFERKITKEEMEELDFKVVGRIFKNINFTL